MVSNHGDVGDGLVSEFPSKNAIILNKLFYFCLDAFRSECNHGNWRFSFWEDLPFFQTKGPWFCCFVACCRCCYVFMLGWFPTWWWCFIMFFSPFWATSIATKPPVEIGSFPVLFFFLVVFVFVPKKRVIYTPPRKTVANDFCFCVGCFCLRKWNSVGPLNVGYVEANPWLDPGAMNCLWMTVAIACYKLFICTSHGVTIIL